MTLTNLQLTNSGTYTVIVSDLAGSTTSSNALLVVGLPPQIYTQPASQSVETNCAAIFSVGTSGTPPLSYQWSKNGVALTGQTNTTLTIAEAQASDVGSYTVALSSPFGAGSSAVAILALGEPPTANTVLIDRFAEGGVRVSAANFTTNNSVALYDTLTVTSVSSNSGDGGTVMIEGPWIYYLPPTNASPADVFNYTVSDGHCGAATGWVIVEIKPDSRLPLNFGIRNIENGAWRLSFDGIPNAPYALEYSDNLSPPDWLVLTNVTADQYGVVEITDLPTNAPARFYRTVSP